MINNLVKKAVEAGGDLFPLIVDSEFRTGLLNPSIYLTEEKFLLNVRHVQYSLYHSENNQYFQGRWGPLAYLHPENDQTLTTVNYFGEILNHKPHIHKVDTSLLDVKPLWEFIGLEDARIAVWDDTMWLIGVRRDTTTNGQGRMEMSKIVPSESGGYKEIERYRLDTPNSNPSYCEKNWVPIIDKPYHFLKWSNPVDIVKVDLSTKMENGFYKCEQVYLSKNTHPLPRDIRGGTQLVPWEDGYLMIGHEVDLFKSELQQKDAFYYHRIFFLNKDFEVERYSDYFNFMTGYIEFGTGLVLVGENKLGLKKDDVYITYGFQDNSAFLLKTDNKFINSLLTNNV